MVTYSWNKICIKLYTVGCLAGSFDRVCNSGLSHEFEPHVGGRVYLKHTHTKQEIHTTTKGICLHVYA